MQPLIDFHEDKKRHTQMMWSLSRKTAPVIDQNMTSHMAALTFDASDNNV